MDVFEFSGCAEVLVAFEDLEVIVEVEFFEEPDYSLGAGLIEPGGELE